MHDVTTHTWVKDSFKVQNTPKDFNLMEYKKKKKEDRVLASMLQTNL